MIFYIKMQNGRQCTIECDGELWLAYGFKNGQWGLNIDAKFFKTKQGAINYALNSMLK